MEGKIIYQGKTSKGIDITFRYPKHGDAPEMCDYINEISKEKTFIMYQGENVILKEEEEFLGKSLERISKKEGVMLLVTFQTRIVGISQITLRNKAEKHIADFGISVAKEFRGQGIGKLLMDLVLKEATTRISDLHIVILGVFANNDLAHKMYKKFGFIEFGILPKGVRHKDNFVDHIHMYKIVREI